VYVADAGNHNVRKITPAGTVTTLAGAAGLPGSADGSGPAARFDTPYGLAVDPTGVVYLADQGNCTIRSLSPSGVVSTLAGRAGQAGSCDGDGAAARFFNPQSVAVDAAGDVYVADTFNSSIRRISRARSVTTVTGVAASIAIFESSPPAGLSRPTGLALWGKTLYVCDLTGNVVLSTTLT
jgi:streptogramin lyase